MKFDPMNPVAIDMIGMTAVVFLADKLDMTHREIYTKLHEERDSMSAKLLAAMWQVNRVMTELEKEKREAENKEEK